MVTLRKFLSREHLFDAAEAMVRHVVGAGGSRPFAILLSGGETPRPLYSRLAEHPFAAPSALRLIPADERMVPDTDVNSNLRQIRAVAAAVAMGRPQVLQVDTSRPLEAAALDYEAQLHRFLAEGVIELGFLGLGADGHTASLFTPADVRSSRGRLAVGVRRESGYDRVTVTADLLAMVRRLVVLVVGPEKRQAVLSLEVQPDTTAAGVLLDGHARAEVWFAPD